MSFDVCSSRYPARSSWSRFTQERISVLMSAQKGLGFLRSDSPSSRAAERPRTLPQQGGSPLTTRLFLLVIALVFLVGGRPAAAQGGQICRVYPTCYSGGCGADTL